MWPAGTRPGGRGTFLCFAKEKYPKERRPQVCDPYAYATGQPAVLAHGVRRGTHCAPAALRSDNHGESVNKAWALGRPCTPHALRSSARPEGNPAIRAIAALGLVCAARGACARECEAERSDGPCRAVQTPVAAPGAGRLRGVPQNSLRAFGASFRQPRQVRQRCMGARAPMPPRKRPAPGAATGV